MAKEKVIIIGAGPCGLSAGIALQNQGFDPLLIEKGNVVQAIYQYPTHQTFFSTAEKLEIGGVPFITEAHKPKRNQALAYYRRVAQEHRLRINSFEQVTHITSIDGQFRVASTKQDGSVRQYTCQYVIIATGYFDHPNMLNIPGEELPKVHHYFKEAHPFFNQKVLVIGGKNSAIDAAMELQKAGAKVTVLYRGSQYSESIKPWILPEFQSMVRQQLISMLFEAEVLEIKAEEVVYQQAGQISTLPNDFVFAMTGYHPDHSFLHAIGVETDPQTGRPVFNPATMETNIPSVYIAGVIAAGNDANEIFIENGRFHGMHIAEHIFQQEKKSTP